MYIVYLINYRIQHTDHFVTLRQKYSLLQKDKNDRTNGKKPDKLNDKPNRNNINARWNSIHVRSDKIDTQKYGIG